MLDRIVERQPIVDHDGRSGASIERVRLDDGTTLILKRSTPSTDITMQTLGDDTGSEYRLFRAGVLDRLPPSISHVVVDVGREDDALVTVMRDVSEHLVGWDRQLTAPELRRVIAALAAMHAAFAGEAIDGVIPLADVLGLLGPGRMAAIDSDNFLVPLIARGWELFAEIVPADVADAVFAVLDDPSGLTAKLQSYPTTLLHGDVSTVNLAVGPDAVTLLDWSLATCGPPAVDVAWLLVSSASALPLSREAVLDEFRHAEGDMHTEDALRLSLFAALPWLGWNKALDVVDNTDATVRERERADLDWWIERALEAPL